MSKKRVWIKKSEQLVRAEELCVWTGLSDQRHRQLAKAGYFPPPIRAEYQIIPTLRGVIRHQRELLERKSDTLRQEQEALTKAKRQMAEEELAKFRSEHIPKSVIGPALRNISLHQRAVLQRKLEQELAPNLVGLTALEIGERVRAAVDELCAIFREGTRQWADTPP